MKRNEPSICPLISGFNDVGICEVFESYGIDENFYVSERSLVVEPVPRVSNGNKMIITLEAEQAFYSMIPFYTKNRLSYFFIQFYSFADPLNTNKRKAENKMYYSIQKNASIH